ncbi:2OG-Fe(II) oxygenase family protein [Sphingomonas sp. BT553]|uniref:2OG-Fe(II) oxygenase family protein n=1 Tax=Sphingomonas mollis TaxID=2795726 RepID=A0ABS0XP40_9SPHN|nr:2OG-Fe(II) oxygenase family protein [Sphingomonas sp. BT553]MBJ6121488.1 2OG-Fe(II) oxygenase family protein [Sphingomonas sp. BT553]
MKAQGDLRGAAACYAQAVAARPDSAVAEHNLASVLGDLNDFAGAAAAAARAIAKGGDAPETWLVRGRALQGLGELDAADDALATAVARRPDYAVAHRDLAQLRWMRSADVGHALTAIERAPSTAALTQVKATVLMEAGDDDRAAAVLRAALASEPGHVGLRLLAAQVAARLGDAEGQLAQASAALRAASASIEAAKAVAEALLHAGRAGEAAALAARIVAAVPDDQGAIAVQATAWRLIGDPRYVALCEDPALVSVTTIETPAGWADLGAFLTDLTSELATRHRWRTHPLEQSVRHGSQTQEDLAQLDVPVVRALFAALDAPIRAHIAGLGSGTDPVRRRVAADYRFAGAWSVRLSPGGFHSDHVHPRGWLSSAFYVALPEAVEREPEGWLALGRPGITTQPALGPVRHIRPRPGQLVLFPSYLWHGTEPFAGEASRLSVAFDLLPA